MSWRDVVLKFDEREIASRVQKLAIAVVVNKWSLNTKSVLKSSSTTN